MKSFDIKYSGITISGTHPDTGDAISDDRDDYKFHILKDIYNNDPEHELFGILQ